MIRAHMLPVATVAMAMVLLGSLPALAEEATVQDAWLRDAVDALRQAEGLSSLRADTRQSGFMQRRLETLLMEQRADTFIPGRMTEAVATTRHWQHRDFVASGDSRSGLLEGLREQATFRAAVLWPEATHFAFGCAQDADGQLWCVGCVTRHMVELDMNLLDAEYFFEGSSRWSLTLSGRTQYPFVRVRFYKGEEDPTEYRGPDHHVDARPDHNGAFRVTLPISMFGEGDYRIVIYVSEGGAEYTIAAHKRFHVDQ
jgi:hypothetical protein